MADAPDLGSGVLDVGVQVPLSAPNQKNTIYCTVKRYFYTIYCGF